MDVRDATRATWGAASHLAESAYLLTRILMLSRKPNFCLKTNATCQWNKREEESAAIRVKDLNPRLIHGIFLSKSRMEAKGQAIQSRAECSTAFFIQRRQQRPIQLVTRWSSCVVHSPSFTVDTFSVKWHMREEKLRQKQHITYLIGILHLNHLHAQLCCALLRLGLHVWSNREIGQLTLFLSLHTKPCWKASLKLRAEDTVSEAIFHAFPWEKKKKTGSHCEKQREKSLSGPLDEI